MSLEVPMTDATRAVANPKRTRFLSFEDVDDRDYTGQDTDSTSDEHAA